MRILVISQYFYPENFKINDLCIGLKEKGHEVTVLTGIPNYPKGVFFEGFGFWKNNDSYWNDIKIYRSKLFPRGNNSIRLMLNYFSFPLFASIKCFFLKEKFDKILVYEPSPITVGIPAIVMSSIKKTPYFFWVQDLWPESLTAAGGISNKIVLKFFDSLTRYIYKKSKKVLVQSNGFKDYIIGQGISAQKIVFYPNSTENFYQPMPVMEGFKNKLPQGFTILFAGNIGEAQSLQTIIEAAKIVKGKNIKINWVFLGDGRMRKDLENQIIQNELTNEVFILGSFPPKDMPFFFACADVLLVTLKKDKIFSLTIPSKVQSYLACKKPIIASLDGEGANIIQEASCGYASPSEDSKLLAENAIKLFNQTDDQRKTMGENALAYYKKEFERDMLLDRLISILNEE